MMTAKVNWTIRFFGGVLACALVSACVASSPEEPTLRVRAGRTMSGLDITNSESGPISNCEVRLLDEGDAEWVARYTGVLAPSETVTLSWAQFKQNGQPVPSYIVHSRSRFIVDCALGDKGGQAGFPSTYRSAGLQF